MAIDALAGAPTVRCEGRLRVDETYARALDHAARGEHRAVRALVARMINEAYTPILIRVGDVARSLNDTDWSRLITRARAENVFTPEFPRATRGFESAFANFHPAPAEVRDRVQYVYDKFARHGAPLVSAFSTAERNRLRMRRLETFAMVVPRRVEPTAGRRMMPSQFLPTSVTAYGYPFTARLMLAGRVMDLLFEQIPDDELRAVFAVHRDPLLYETLRGRQINARAHENLHEVFADGVREGIMTVVQAITLLMADAHPDYPDPDPLLRLITTSPGEGGGGLITKLSVVAPTGYVGPMGLSGWYVPDLLTTGSHGRLRLNPSIRSILINVRDKDIREADQIMSDCVWETYLEPRTTSQHGLTRTNFLGRGCPVATRQPGREVSSLQAFTSAFYEVYRRL